MTDKLNSWVFKQDTDQQNKIISLEHIQMKPMHSLVKKMWWNWFYLSEKYNLIWLNLPYYTWLHQQMSLEKV